MWLSWEFIEGPGSLALIFTYQTSIFSRVDYFAANVNDEGKSLICGVFMGVCGIDNPFLHVPSLKN